MGWLNIENKYIVACGCELHFLQKRDTGWYLESRYDEEEDRKMGLRTYPHIFHFRFHNSLPANIKNCIPEKILQKAEKSGVRIALKIHIYLPAMQSHSIEWDG